MCVQGTGLYEPEVAREDSESAAITVRAPYLTDLPAPLDSLAAQRASLADRIIHVIPVHTWNKRED